LFSTLRCNISQRFQKNERNYRQEIQKESNTMSYAEDRWKTLSSYSTEQLLAILVMRMEELLLGTAQRLDQLDQKTQGQTKNISEISLTLAEIKKAIISGVPVRNCRDEFHDVLSVRVRSK
jgi:hypothetical protein